MEGTQSNKIFALFFQDNMFRHDFVDVSAVFNRGDRVRMKAWVAHEWAVSKVLIMISDRR
jgi:hypothetical protein